MVEKFEKYLLDSDVIIDYIKGKKEAVDLISMLIIEKSTLIVSSIVVYELFKGCFKSRNVDKHINVVTRFLDYIHIIDFDSSCAVISANLFASLKEIGCMIGESDILIASICLRNNYTLVTNNLSHFERIRNLKIKNLKNNL